MIFSKVTLSKSLRTPKLTEYYEYTNENDRRRPWGIDGGGIYAHDGVDFANVTPRKGEELTFLELPIDPMKFYGLTEPALKCVIAYVGSIKIVGWIDGVEPLSVQGQNTRIRWHVDYFITCQLQNTFKFGEGRFKRFSESYARPDPSQPRFWWYSDEFNIEYQFTDINEGDSKTNNIVGPYCIIYYLNTTATETSSTTYFETYFFPVAEAGGTEEVYWGNDIYHFPRIYDGKLDENLKLDSDKIVGCWISPIPPSELFWRVKAGQYYGYYKITDNNMTDWLTLWRRQSETDYLKFRPDDFKKVIIQDPYGTIYATIPWKMEFKTLFGKLDISADGGTLILFLKDDDDGHGEGRIVQIPLIGASVTSNAWSSYNYSGQREYDKRIAEIQREQNLKNGIANSGTSAIGGAVAGGLTGNPLMAGAGAVAGLISSIAGSYASDVVNREADEKTQTAVDKLTASQTASCVVSGSGNSWTLKIGHTDLDAGSEKWRFVILERDPISKAELEAEHEKLGFVTDFYCADCTTLIAAGGPMRIENLKISGVSKEAQNYISNLFNNGIYLEPME